MNITINEETYLPAGIPYDPILVMAAITGATILINAIAEIADGVIVNDHISDGTINAYEKIVTESIQTNQIAANAITSTRINANAVTTDKLAADSITSVKISSGAITTDKIAADAVTAAKINVSSLDAISATLGHVVTGSLTAVELRTSIDPGQSRVLIDSAGLRGYDQQLGLTFRIPTDGSAPLFASGQIQSATIIDTTIISNEFHSSSELPWVEVSDEGVGYRETEEVGQYSTFKYGSATSVSWDSGESYTTGDLVKHNDTQYIATDDSEDIEPGVDDGWEDYWDVITFGVYGVGVTAFYGNFSRPILSVEAEREFADIRLYNRSSDPSGAAQVGDLMVKGGILYICTTAGTPGSFTCVGDQTAS